MTIDTAKKDIEDALYNNCLPSSEAIEVAIASLEAWEKVKQEIKKHFRYNFEDGDVIFYDACQIIDKHLQEVQHDD